jgi:Beta-lactamase enzyme family
VTAEASPTPTADGAAVLSAQLATIQDDSQGIDFSVAVVDHRSGMTYQWEADTPFVTASIVKVEILAGLLLQLRESGQSMTGTQRQLATTMIENSDNDAATTLWRSIGSAQGLAEVGDVFGLTDTTPGTSSWGSTTTTVGDQVALLDAIADADGPLGSENTIVLDLMASVADDQDWGVSAAARDGETVRLKNGWGTQSSAGGTWAINSIGLIQGPDTDLTIAVLSSGHATQSSGVAFVEQLAALARAALDPAT